MMPYSILLFFRLFWETNESLQNSPRLSYWKKKKKSCSHSFRAKQDHLKSIHGCHKTQWSRTLCFIKSANAQVISRSLLGKCPSWVFCTGKFETTTWGIKLETLVAEKHSLGIRTHSSVLVWRIPGIGGAWWAAVYGVAQSRTRLKWLSSSSSRH